MNKQEFTTELDKLFPEKYGLQLVIFNLAEKYKEAELKGQILPLDNVVDTEGQLLAFSKFLLNRSYVRGKYYPETLVKLFKGK